MKTKIMLFSVVFFLFLFTEIIFGGTEGPPNVFYGDNAGSSSTGSSNTFIGVNAGSGNAGDSNTFIGYDAGHSSTGNTGNFNTFIGRAAGVSNTTGPFNTFLGVDAGFSNTTGGDNTFLGEAAGRSNTAGGWNTFLGDSAGHSNTDGWYNTFVGGGAGTSHTGGWWNTFLGWSAGHENTTGDANVFLGYRAGYYETESNRLYIDNSDTSTPLIYGEFDNELLRINGRGHFSGLGVSRSQLHFSMDNTDTGGWITSVLDNNFWLSSGAAWDQAAGGWVQKSPDGLAVMAGSGAAGYRVLTRSGCAVGTVCPTTSRLVINYSGNVGLGITPAHPLHLAGGAYSDGGHWIDGSSREYKDNIRELTVEDAVKAFQGLNPVAFTYKARAGEQHVGFIAEDVPDLVATKDRKGLSSMDIVAVLTKVVQEQQKTISNLREELNELKGKVK